MNNFGTIIVGGGAAGFFCAASITDQKTLLLEKNLKVLSKVLISGGGRCNVTHACFDPKALAAHYPRGSQELIGVFSRFQPLHTIDWFKERGVELKTEEDGRMFPITNSSETIVSCLIKAINDADVKLMKGVKICSIKKENGHFIIQTEDKLYSSKKLVLATGSSPQGHAFAKDFGHTITPLAPSLFTFNTPTSFLLDLAGITVSNVTVSILGTELKETGSILLTHFGFSGPAILRLSAWGARELHEKNYHAKIKIDWTGGKDRNQLKEKMINLKMERPSTYFSLEMLSYLPKNLCKALYPQSKRLAEISNKEIEAILDVLTSSIFLLEGKTTYKHEFVTCGGVDRKEIDFKTMQSRLCEGLYFAGEILDIDGITGGFNFQNAWATAYIAGRHISRAS